MLIRLSPQIRHLQCALLRANSTESRAQEVRKVFGFSESDIPEPLKAGKSRTRPPQATPSNVARGDFGSDVISGSKKNDPDTGYGGRKAARQNVKVETMIVAERIPMDTSAAVTPRGSTLRKSRSYFMDGRDHAPVTTLATQRSIHTPVGGWLSSHTSSLLFSSNPRTTSSPITREESKKWLSTRRLFPSTVNSCQTPQRLVAPSVLL